MATVSRGATPPSRSATGFSRSRSLRCLATPTGRLTWTSDSRTARRSRFRSRTRMWPVGREIHAERSESPLRRPPHLAQHDEGAVCIRPDHWPGEGEDPGGKKSVTIDLNEASQITVRPLDRLRPFGRSRRWSRPNKGRRSWPRCTSGRIWAVHRRRRDCRARRAEHRDRAGPPPTADDPGAPGPER